MEVNVSRLQAAAYWGGLGFLRGVGLVEEIVDEKDAGRVNLGWAIFERGQWGGGSGCQGGRSMVEVLVGLISNFPP